MLIYDKITKLRYGACSPGETVNLVSSDCQRLIEAGTHGVYLIKSPVFLLCTIIVMILIIGQAALFGFILLFSLMPLQGYFGRLASKHREESSKLSDKRVRLMNEILNGVKLIKLYAWEPR